MSLSFIKDSIGFVFNTRDSSTTVLYDDRIDTSYSRVDMQEGFGSKRSYSSIQIPVMIGYGYSLGKFSMLMKAGLWVDILVDHSADSDAELPRSTIPVDHKFNWAVSVSPELWYSVTDRLDLKLGAHYYRQLSDDKERALLPYEPKGTIRYNAGINYRIGKVFR